MLRNLLITGILIVGLLVITGPVDALTQSRFDHILVMPDTSGSLDELECARVEQDLAAQLEDIIGLTGASRVSLLPWGDLRSCWVSPVTSAAVPQQRAVPLVTLLRTEADIFAVSWKRKEERAVTAMERRQAEVDSSFRRGLSRVLDPLQTRLVNLRQGYADCTPIEEVLARCSAERRSTLAIVVTDALNDCGWRERATSFLPEGATVVMVLVPTKGEGEGVVAGLQARRRDVLSRAPWVKIVFGFQVSGNPQEWLLPLLPQNAAVSESGR